MGRQVLYPPALAAALESLARVGTGTDAAPVTSPLWLADPRPAPPEPTADYADLETRVAVLREL